MLRTINFMDRQGMAPGSRSVHPQDADGSARMLLPVKQ
jgi:hypothetical protein